MSNWLGIDFGTSNSAAAYFGAGAIERVRFADGQETIPTAVFFCFDRKVMDTGQAAHDAMLDGLDGRYMRSLKRVLGTSLMSEQRMMIGRKLDFFDIISDFLRRMKDRAEAQAGCTFDKAVAGRPVLFDSNDAGKNARAATDLEKCYRMAGFREVIFLPEPEAAAFSVDRAISGNAPGVVVDIGGGTSDFTVFNKQRGGIEVVASSGIRIGGTDYDRALNLNFIMPHMGYRHPVRIAMSTETIAAPAGVYNELATWEKIPFLYTPQTTTLVKSLVRDAIEPTRFRRLLRAIEGQLGHDIALIAEGAKIGANESGQTSNVDLGLIERGLEAVITPDDFHSVLDQFFGRLTGTLDGLLNSTGIVRDEIAHIVPVGGSSLLRPVREAFSAALPNAEIVDAPIFTAIVDGLALHSRTLA